jgi:hypothetical protein
MTLPIKGIIGPPGSGKTALAAWMSYVGYQEGRKIFSNTLLRFPFDWVSRRDLVERIAVLTNCVVLVSEIQVFMDSRRFASKGNIEASYLFTQTRKRNVDFLWDSQKLHQVDKRLRDLTDWLYVVSRANRYEPMTLKNGSRNPRFNPWALVEVIDGTTGMVVNKFWFNIERSFGLYDTEQIIDPMQHLID